MNNEWISVAYYYCSMLAGTCSNILSLISGDNNRFISKGFGLTEAVALYILLKLNILLTELEYFSQKKAVSCEILQAKRPGNKA